MPLYDFRCPHGHTTEHRVSRAQRSMRCACGLWGQRIVVPSRVGVTGFATTPIRERPIPLNRFIEAQGQLVHDAERRGLEPPDTLGFAKRQAKEIQERAPELLG